jgi:hypothetical protein
VTEEQIVTEPTGDVLVGPWPAADDTTTTTTTATTERPVNVGTTTLGPDLAGDTPLTPEWVKTREGWKTRSAIAVRQSARGSRRWLRRQTTEHGYVPMVGRGVAGVYRWTAGAEGAAVHAARLDARTQAEEAKAANRRYRTRLLPGKERDRLLSVAKVQKEEAIAAAAVLAKAKTSARRAVAIRSLASVAMPAAGLTASGVYGGSVGLGAASAALVTGLGWLGRHTGGESYTSEVDAKIGDGVKPSAEVVDKAMREAGILKNGHTVTMRLPAALDGRAWVMPLALSGGPTVATVRARIAELAAAFGVPVYQVDVIDSDDGRGDQFTLWVSTADPFKQVFVSPLVDKPVRTDAFGRGILVGYNRRGEPVYLKLGHVMALLGGASRTGKGMLLRNLICGIGLDPNVNLRLVAGAKPGEHAGYAPVCATFFGRDPYRLIVLLEEILEEGKRREEILIDRKKAKASARDLEEFPLEVLIIDEYKQYAESTVRVPDPNDPNDDPEKPPRTMKACDRIAGLLEEIAAFVAALNITVLISTQDPDANTIPRGFKSNSIARVATRTMSPVQTNAILKDGATGAGMVAHEIPKSLKGAALVDIDGYEGELIRSCFIEDEKYDGAADIIAAGVTLRREVGRLPGQFTDPIEQYLAERTGYTSVAGGEGGFGRPSRADAAGEGAVSVVSVALKVMSAADVDRMPTGVLLEAMAEAAPEAFGEMTEAGLRDALKEAGAGSPVQLGASSKWGNVRGFKREALEPLA